VKFKALYIAAFAVIHWPAAAGPATFTGCESAQILLAEIDAALAICGPFDIFGSTSMTVAALASSCPIEKRLSDYGHAAFRGDVAKRGKIIACRAMLQATTTRIGR
jgi:hypothetical protein